ncbi:hypothetical protein DSC_15165 [Pseudoxanthomonas spadix BD-a59]|uniref:Uncharacterized protein n=1 Tax=Pseudoxanthomonas spadix (strain BD-a59) TaxID=1045855 RepID=G7UW19_PSEUP|nr:hypothetical protein DSC_15165 [Pseudoxanthomonas spadix BD-a59]
MLSGIGSPRATVWRRRSRHGLAAEKLQGPKLQAGGAAVRKQVEVENRVGRVSFESRGAGMSEVSTIGAWCRGE